MTYKELIDYTAQHKIVPVFFHENPDIAIKTVKASYEGGVRIFEFVNRSENGLDVFKQIIKEFNSYNDLKIGVGTIYDSQTAAAFINAGAQFVVSPGLVNELGSYCIEQKVAYIPGVGTITEAITAMHLGCKMIKLFPANVIGSAFAKAVKSVMPQLAIMPTGGIRPIHADLSEWFKAGVSCVGMGSQLFDKEKIKKSDFTSLSEDIALAINVTNQL